MDKKFLTRLKRDKKGLTGLMLIAYVFMSFFGILFLGIGLYSLGLFDDTMLELGEMIGNISGQNFTQAYENTTQQGVNAIFSIADVVATLLLLGLALVMIFVGYQWGDESKRLWVIADILFIVGAFIIAVYLQIYFVEFVSGGIIDETVYTETLATSSGLIARLPFLVPTIGMLIMIVTYGLSRKKQQAAFSDLGY